MTKSDLKNKKVFTTGDVARLLHVNINTVIKWFDEGKINGFRLPMSNDRRITIGYLRAFMAEHSIPRDLLDDSGHMRREYERVSCNSPVRFSLSNGKDYGTYEGVLYNISKGGARITASGKDVIAIPMNKFKLNMNILDQDMEETTFSGEIVHMQPEDGDISIGMKFFSLEPGSDSKLAEYLDKF